MKVHHNWLFTKYFWPFLIALILATLFSVLLFCFALLSKEKDEVVTILYIFDPKCFFCENHY